MSEIKVSNFGESKEEIRATIQSAVQKAMDETNPDITGAHFKALEANQQRHLNGGTGAVIPLPRYGVQPTVVTIQVIADSSCFAEGANGGKGYLLLATDSELAQLREAEAKIAALESEQEKYQHHKVTEEYMRQHREIQSAAHSGNVDGTVLVSRESIAVLFRTRTTALNVAMAKLTAEILPLCKKVIGRFRDSLEDQMRGFEEADREQAEVYGYAFQPGYVWQAAANVASTVCFPNWPRPDQHRKPSAMLKGIVEL